jgi:predicted DNA-binding transcriptional regulator AlpA
MSSVPLLPQFAVVRLYDGQDLEDIVTKAVHRVLEVRPPKITPPAAVKAAGAAAHLGISRSHFYQLLDSDPRLAKLAFTAGRSRLWPVVALDAWMRAKQCAETEETT